jgi:glucose-fructose oxidoreductase
MHLAILRFPGERMRVFTCSFGAADVSAVRNCGNPGPAPSRSRLRFPPTAARQIIKTNGPGEIKSRTQSTIQFAPLLIHFSDCVLEDREPEPSGLEGLRDVRIIECTL